MKQLVRMVAYVVIGIVTLTAVAGCDGWNNMPAEDVAFSLVWTNDIGETLYLSDCYGRSLDGVTFHLKDTFLKPGESITVATAKRLINQAKHGDKESYKARLFERMQDCSGFTLKYGGYNTLFKLKGSSENKIFNLSDYKTDGNILKLSITYDLLNEYGVEAVQGKEKVNKIEWRMHTTLPVRLRYADASGKSVLIDREVKPGETIRFVAVGYSIFPDEYHGMNVVTENSARKFYESFSDFTFTAPDLRKNGEERKFDISAFLPYIFDLNRYEAKYYGDDSTVYTLPVYNETLFREFPLMGSVDTDMDIIRWVLPVSWLNKTDEDMHIDLRLKQHLVYSIGESHFDVTLAPGEKLQLNPIISYGGHTDNPDIRNDAAAWSNYVSEIESLTIKYAGNKEYVLDKANPADFILNTKKYMSGGVYVLTDNSFPE